MKIINFDMDGTIANFYGVVNWLDYLMTEDVYPYVAAAPLLNLSALARRLNQLQKAGYQINIISWTSRNGSASYNGAVTIVKRKWLKKHMKSVKWDNIFIVPYGTPKHEISSGILFDDEERNRTAWGAGAYDVNDILDVLRTIWLNDRTEEKKAVF